MTHRLLPKPDAGADDVILGDIAELKGEFVEDSGRYYVSFPDNQWWSPVGAIGDLMHLGLSLFWFHSRTLIVSG